MQISNVLSGYPDPTALGKRGETAQTAGARGSQTVELRGSTAAESSAALAEILSHYDVADISPAEFTEMIQKLYEAAAISDKELQQLAAIRHDLDTADIDPDESLDLLEFYAEKIEKLQRRLDESEGPSARRQQLGPLLRRLDWIEKFSLIQSAPDAIGLDAMA